MTFREQICKWLTKGKHTPVQGDDGKCLICGRLVNAPTPDPVPDTPPAPKPDEPAEKPEGETAGDPPDEGQPHISPPRWEKGNATDQNVNRWNEATTGHQGRAKILIPAKYRDRTCWATLWDAGGAREKMEHVGKSDNGGRPRFYAARGGASYKGPVHVLVQTLDGDLFYTIPNPAQGIK